jgi:DNA-directed RNA polymerase specialized sigma subunit
LAEQIKSEFYEVIVIPENKLSPQEQMIFEAYQRLDDSDKVAKELGITKAHASRLIKRVESKLNSE